MSGGTNRALTFAEIAAWARDDLGALDAASAKLVADFLATIPVRQRFAAVAAMRRRMQVLSRLAGRLDSLEDDLCSESSRHFMDRDQKIRLYGVMANRESAMLRQVEEPSPEPLVVPTPDNGTPTPPDRPVEEIAAVRIVSALETLGDALSRAAVRRVSRPPVLVAWET